MFDIAFISLTLFCLFAQRAAPKKPSGGLDMNTVIMLVLGAGIIAILTVVAYYVGSHLRKGAVEKEKPPSLSDHLATFREAKDEGNMTAVEFATVQKHLAQKIMDEVKQENPRKEPDNDLPEFIPQ